ncbi:OsmC family protein [Kitasatospora sp. NPDC088351]|uniref:OsmC family protein n=1 Tax=unclassified Kitasatospora TaxID=2633591 RepID=UPI00342CC57A
MTATTRPNAPEPLLETAPDPQPGLREYLTVKRAALLAKRDGAADATAPAPTLRVRTTAEHRSGVRRIRIREHTVISDSPLDFAGYDLGPTSPELQLGVLSSCLTHIYLIQASDLRIPLDALTVEVAAEHDGRAGTPGFEDVPIYPHNIRYTVRVTSPATRARIEELHASVERNCPIYNLLREPQKVTGEVVHTLSGDAARPDGGA